MPKRRTPCGSLPRALRRWARRTLAVGGALAWSAPLLAQAVPAAAPLTVDDLLTVRAFATRAPLDLSPDGQLVAYGLVDPGRAAELSTREPAARRYTRSGVPLGQRASDVYLADARNGTSRRLTDGTGSSWGPVWSPDGRRLAFYSDRDGAAGLWVWDRDRDSMRRLCADVVRPNFEFEVARWSPDGTRLLVKLLPQDRALDALRAPAGARPAMAGPVTAGAATAVVYSTGPASDAVGASGSATAPAADVFAADLALVDVATGAVRRLARGDDIRGYRFAPDGARVAFTTRRAAAAGAPSGYELAIVDTAGGAPRALAPRMESAAEAYGVTFSWSPDATRIAFTSYGALHVVAVAGGDSAVRLERPRARFTASYRPPLWLDDRRLVAVAADTIWRADARDRTLMPAATIAGRQLQDLLLSADAERGDVGAGRDALAVVTRDPATMRMGIHRVDLRSGTSVRAYEDDVSIATGYAMDRTADGRRAVFLAQHAAAPADIWMLDGTGGTRATTRRLTNVNPTVTARPLGRTRLLTWRAPSGGTLRGTLILPAHYEAGRRYPLVVRVYGGDSLSTRLHRFAMVEGVDNLQMLATRGYAVLLPDAPLRDGQPLGDLAATVLPGIDAAIATGVADSTRVGLMGHSYGAYSALALLVQSSRFRAAAVSGGFSSLLTQYARLRDGAAPGIAWAERGQGRMGASPWEARERYLENSPFFHLDRLTAPLLLLHGGADPIVPVAASEETFVALRRLGRTATLVRYDGEGHHVATWGRANAIDFWARVVAWFDRYLCGDGAPPSGGER